MIQWKSAPSRSPDTSSVSCTGCHARAVISRLGFCVVTVG